MLRQLLGITRNTFIESIRQPIFPVLAIVMILLLAFGLHLAANTLDDDNKIMIDMGLSTLFVGGLFLAAFTATGVLSEEVENKTVLTVVSKPVARTTFVLGKYFGVAGALAVAYWALAIIFLLTVRHRVMQVAGDPHDWPVLTFGGGALLLAAGIGAVGNYLYHWVFNSSFIIGLSIFETIAYLLVLVINKDWKFQAISTEFVSNDNQVAQLLVGMLLVFLGVMVVTAVAIAASTRMGQIMTLVVCFLVFALGMTNDYFLGVAAKRAWGYDALYRIIPNMQVFWPADALTQGTPFTGHYVLWVAAYAALLVGAVLGLAVFLFQTREVG